VSIPFALSLSKGSEAALLSRLLNPLVHTPRPISFEIDAHVREADLLEAGDDRGARVAVEQAVDLRGGGQPMGFDSLCTPLYITLMKLPISEARKRLPELVRRVRRNAEAKVEITVRDEVVAELRGPLPEPRPGAAAKKLRALMRKLPKARGPKTRVSSRVGQYLYGYPGRKR